MLMKRRGQERAAQIEMIDYCISIFDSMPTREEKYNLMQTVIDVSDGKMYLECQYARTIKRFCAMLEEDGKP